MKIFSSPIQCSNRSERRIKEIEAVTQLVARAFGPGAELRHTDEGRPYIDGRDDVYISISHCADICLLAVSDTPVGIDAETARDQLIGIAHKFLTQGEMARAPHSLTTLMRLWAAKEYLSGKDSTYSIYNVGGDAALLPNHTKKLYSKSFKLDVLQA